MLYPPIQRERQVLIESLCAAEELLRAMMPRVGSSTDIEALHDFRVALRRIRTLLAPLRGFLPLQDIDALRDETRWLAGRTSSLRDYDVLLDRMENYASDIPGIDPETVAELVAEIRRRRNRQRAALLRSLNTRRASQLLTSLATMRELDASDPDWPLASCAGSVLWRAYKRVVRLGRKIDERSPSADLHELRKRCKRFRYLLEALGPLYPQSERDSLLKALRKLQNVLGDFQDFDTHQAIFDELKSEITPEEPGAEQAQELVNELLVVLQRRRKRVRAKLRRRFAKFANSRDHAHRRRMFKNFPLKLGLNMGSNGYCHGWVDGRAVGLPVGKIVCVGRNFAEHAIELNNPVPQTPLLFIKPPSAAVDLGPRIRIGQSSSAVHHEAEIALLVTRFLPRGHSGPVLPAIGGIGLALDLTLRELQADLKARSQPWEIAKGFDGACPLSGFKPLDDPLRLCQPISFELRVNGEARQKGDSAEMIFPIQSLVSEILNHFSLWPGDVVLTGTPAGVGPLVDGDCIEAVLDGEMLASGRVCRGCRKTES